MLDYRQVAKSSPIFQGLSEEEKSSLLNGGKIRYLNKKEVLFRHGDPLVNLYIICFGSIQTFRSNSQGDEKTLNVLTVHDIICGNKIYEPCATHQYSAMAVTDAAVLEFPKNWLKENVKKYGDFALNLLAFISKQNEMAELEVEHKIMMSAPQILACFLQKLCMVYDLDPKGFELPYGKKLIASRLGIEFETLSRTLAKLKEYGIEVSGNRVTIKNMDHIEERVCNSCSIEGSCHVHNSLRDKF